MIEKCFYRRIFRLAGMAVSAVMIGIIAFNVYYFFIARGVGPGFYLQRVLESPKDHILEDSTYQDLVKEYEYFNRMYTDSKTIVFLGDSITARFKVGEYFGYRPVLNRGIYSDTTVGVINRIDRNCNNLSISKCFVMIGYNDLKYRSDEEIVRNYENILKVLKADRVYVLSLLPVGKNYGESVKRIPKLNLKLREIAEKNRNIYIDLYSRFVTEEGFVKPELTLDGVHPNGDGYAEAARILEDYVNGNRK